MKIEIGKFYKDRIGRKVRIYAIEENGDYPIHGAVFDNNTWISRGFVLNGKYFKSCTDSSDDIVSEWQEPLDFDWDCLPKWADRYIVMDRHKDWMCVESKPLIRYENSNAWTARAHSNYNIIPENFYPKNFTGDWKDSLFKNPKYKD